MMKNMLARMITVPTPPSVYIGFRGVSTGSTSSSNNQLNLNAPANLAANDVLIAQIAVRGGTSTTITPPAGWTLVQLDTNRPRLARGSTAMP